MGAGVPIDVSDRPRPEADAFFETMRRFFATREDDEAEPEENPQGPSYFEGGPSPEMVGRFVHTGSALAKLRPWDFFPNQTLIRLDIPDLKLSEVCICIIGALRESRSVLIFRSAHDYMLHVGRAERLAERSEFSVDPVEPGVPIIALDFEDAEDTPARMVEEAAEMGLMRGRKVLYPFILCIDPDGVKRPTTERDLLIVHATAAALEQIFRQHGPRVGDPARWPICENVQVRELNLEVRLTVPLEGAVFFGINAPPPAPPKPPAATSRAIAGAAGNTRCVTSTPTRAAAFRGKPSIVGTKWGPRPCRFSSGSRKITFSRRFERSSARPRGTMGTPSPRPGLSSIAHRRPWTTRWPRTSWPCSPPHPRLQSEFMRSGSRGSRCGTSPMRRTEPSPAAI